MALPNDYVERVYAGVLGKIIGVYLGRPFEGWTYDRIMEHLGEVNYYVHEKFDVPLIVTDDDISGTFTFVRALPDYGNSTDLTAAQIGQTWLNYLIEERTILWWGGMGNSTEHTAYMRLKQGIPAPQSGSIEMNGQVVAEQIGAQIFIDGWAMVAPGDPELASHLARRAGSVSHDGEALYGAQVLAAMESLAFVEPDIDKLLDTAVTMIPRDSTIYALIADIRNWHAQEKDWRKAREKIAASYGYDKYGGNCHMVPNHALIVHALLYGEDDFQRSLMIVNTSGWDTDCNSGNVGCLLGIKNGLAGIDLAGPDWRGPVADRLYLPTADGGRAISDAVSESFELINVGRALAGKDPLKPKDGARYHFELPGSVQGFMVDESIESAGAATVRNEIGHSLRGERSLAIDYRGVATGRVARVGTATFVPSKQIADYFRERGYALLASPKLYPGQTVRARVEASIDNTETIACSLFVQYYEDEDDLRLLRGESVPLAAGAEHEYSWTIPDIGGNPIARVGVEVSSETRADGSVYLDYLTWEGTPDVVLGRPNHSGQMWRHAWINGVSYFGERWWPEPYRLIQNEGRGLISQGARDWTDYRALTSLTLHMVSAAGIAVRVQGMRRYYALLLCNDGKARIVKALDGDKILAEADFPWAYGETHQLELTVSGNRLTASIDGEALVTVTDDNSPLTGGAVGVVVEEGRVMLDAVSVKPLA